MPKRIQRKRTKGWKMPEGAVYVGRPTKYGNPYKIGARYRNPFDGGIMVVDVEAAMNLYRDWIKTEIVLDTNLLEDLRGKDLACWCPLDQKCHADILLELANK